MLMNFSLVERKNEDEFLFSSEENVAFLFLFFFIVVLCTPIDITIQFLLHN